VRQVNLDPGQVVDTGTVLVALDVSVESAELNALKSEAALAASILERATGLRDNHAIAEDELDRARANYDVSRSRIARTQAIIERKTIRAPFRARVGIADLHPGQYLLEGTEITSLQGVDDAVHIDFEVEQQVAAGLAGGDRVQVVTDGRNGTTVNADIVAVDARVDPRTRNATVRARIDDADGLERVPGPGASVQVVVPAGAEQDAVVVPASALRKGPAGDHIYVILEDPDGNPRAHQRPVEVAALQGDEVVISAGVEVGDEVAAAGSFKLREAVLIAQADSQHADAAR
jgi:membrane fusion protein (multidrug efflux system)